MSVGTPGALPTVPATAGNLGQGIKYPPEIDANGRLALSSGTDLVSQALLSICQTQPKERVMQPDYGAASTTFEPADLIAMQTVVKEQAATHESRAQNVTFTATPLDSTGKVRADISYETDGDSTVQTLTFPLFVGPSVTGPSE